VKYSGNRGSKKMGKKEVHRIGQAHTDAKNYDREGKDAEKEGGEKEAYLRLSGATSACITSC